MSDRLRICLIASSRFPVAEPFAGGLEAHTHQLASELVRRGHEVTLFAGPGSDPALTVNELAVETFTASDAARNDVAAWPDQWMSEHHAYLGLMLDLAGSASDSFDVIHNNSLHHLPIAMARTARVPMLTTLHTPPVPWLESAIRLNPDNVSYVAVSQATANAWQHVVDSSVVHNGVDTTTWAQGSGGGPAIWTGRIVPEKGAHLAIRAAMLAGFELELAGPISDTPYFEQQISPLLGPRVRYLGHLDHRELARRVGAATVALVTPRWDEPYGLVAAEAMSCGTPVASFARGALAEIIDEHSGAFAAPDDVEGLATAMHRAAQLDRNAVRAHAVATCSLTTMVDAYEQMYRRSVHLPRAA